MQISTTNCIKEVYQKKWCERKKYRIRFLKLIPIKFPWAYKTSCEFDICQDVFLGKIKFKCMSKRKDANKIQLRISLLFYVIWSIKTVHISNLFIFSRFFTNKNIEVSEKFEDSRLDFLEDYVIMSWLKKKAELYIHQMLFFITTWRDWFFFQPAENVWRHL